MSQALRNVVPWVVRGLTYEIQRGDYSVGSNVRDAACYVMWSFARMPNPESRRVFGEMSLQMSTTLISVAVFDRESNVRRAASAAFQEHVGRHSLFPHGISVLQLADFFSVGNMRNAFVVSSRKIAEYSEYRQPLLHHLCTGTIYHWEYRTRELAAAALRESAPLAAQYVVEDLLPQIAANTTSPFLAVRHGAILATGVVAEVLAAELRDCNKSTKQHQQIVTKHIVVETSGSSRENFVRALSALKGYDVFETLCRFIVEGAKVEIRRNASAALGEYCRGVYNNEDNDGDVDAADSRADMVMAIDALLDGLLDHTVDNRGDVGSWVRKQCLISLADMFKANPALLSALSPDHGFALRLIGRTLHAATEKIDKLRLAAGRLLETLIYQQNRSGMDLRIKRIVDHLGQYISVQERQTNKEDR
ncbi:hypothetical protein J3B02_004394 [Coemansia erecta]|nr:hypothetical protein J3B02_004394 [Coemansia erecta]